MLVPARRPGPPARGAPSRGRGLSARGAGPLIEPPGRAVGLDYGRRRIGVAVSDPTRTIASPHAVIDRRSGGVEPPESLVRMIGELRPSTIVVGIPLQLDGNEGEMAREARAFATALRSRIDVPVVEWDERLSTVRAEREIRAMELPRHRRREKGIADRVAAALILEGYLRSRSESGSRDE